MDDYVTVRYGKTGTAGQSQTTPFADAAAAGKNAQYLDGEKLARGIYLGAQTPRCDSICVVSPMTDWTLSARCSINPRSPV